MKLQKTHASISTAAVFSAFSLVSSAFAADVESKPAEVTQSVDTNGEIRVEVVGQSVYDTYKTLSTESFSYIATDPAVLPASVHQFTPKAMSDLGTHSFKDVADYLPGVHNDYDHGYVYCYSYFNVRGFRSENPYRDGMRSYGGNAVDVDTLESIDVVKGPSSVQYGKMAPGGVVNYVTKGAKLDKPGLHGEVKAYATDAGRWHVSGAANEMVNEDFAVFAQVGYTGGETYRQTRKNVLSAVFGLKWRPTDDDEIDVRFAYTHEERDMQDGCLIVNGQVYGDRWEHWDSANVGNFRGQVLDDYYLTGKWTHKFSESFENRLRMKAHYFDHDVDAIRMPSYNASTGRLSGRLDQSDMSIFETQVSDDFAWVYDDLDWMENTLLAGIEFHTRNYTRHQRWWNGAWRNLAGGPWNFGTTCTTGDHAQNQNLYSFAPFAQEQMKLFDSLHIVAGVRWDWIYQENRNITGGWSKTRDYDSLVYNGGVLYELTDWLHPYYSYQTSFNPQTHVQDIHGNLITEPTTGEQHEIGFKSPWFDNRLLLSACWFQVDKHNVAQAIPGTDYYTLNGHVRSQGVELAAQGQVGDYVEVIGAYSYTHAYYVEADSSHAAGESMAYIPHNNGSLWGVWHLDGVREATGLRVGFGAVAMDARPVNSTMHMSAYYTLNAMVGYGLKLWDDQIVDLQLNLFNLSNQEYWQSCNGSYGMPGQLFGGQFTVKFIF